jgi:hypothetical protein
VIFFFFFSKAYLAGYTNVFSVGGRMLSIHDVELLALFGAFGEVHGVSLPLPPGGACFLLVFSLCIKLSFLFVFLVLIVFVFDDKEQTRYLEGLLFACS